jgi:hypothetical protein
VICVAFALVGHLLTRFHSQQKEAQTKLNMFKEDPDSWLLVDAILQNSKYEQTKYLGLQVLDHVITTRWSKLHHIFQPYPGPPEEM